jgi:putative transposase
VLSALPKRLHPRAKELLHAISYAESRTKALAAAKEFADELSAHPKAVAKITSELGVLLTFYDFPEPHWKHLRTTNPSRPSQRCGCELGLRRLLWVGCRADRRLSVG